MERLTKRDGSGRAYIVTPPVQRGGVFRGTTQELMQQAIERLAAYEDCRLDPVQCADMATVSGILQTLEDGTEYTSPEWARAQAPVDAALEKVEDEELREEINDAVGGFVGRVQAAAMWYGMRCMKDIFRPLEP